MATTEKVLLCQNIGCGQQYREEDNEKEDKCCYHSCEPLFHDVYKIWPCCQRKSRDFTQFLAIKGCTFGKHSNIKKEKKELKIETEVETKIEQKIEEKVEEKKQVFEFNEKDFKALEVIETKNVLKDSENDLDLSQEKQLIICKNCRKSEQNVKNEKCFYHSGSVVFHDSLKYWTCCSHKKFTDFQDFESFKECKESEFHEFERKELKPRIDWFQTNGSVNIILYSLKGVRAQKGTKVETNGRHLRAKFCDRNGFKVFEINWDLNEFILSEKSKVIIDKNKVEINLEKFDKTIYWNKLS